MRLNPVIVRGTTTRHAVHIDLVNRFGAVRKGRAPLVLAGLVTLVASLVVGLAGSATPVRAAAPTYAVVDLGTLGGRSSRAMAINAAGQIVGGADTAAGAEHAFLYSNGQMQDLGTLPGEPDSVARGVSDTGLVVGDAYKKGFAVGSGSVAFLFDGKSMQPLPTLGGKEGSGRGVNRQGHVAGASSLPSKFEHPTLIASGAAQDLSPGQNAEAIASGVNDADMVVGFAFTRSGFRAFLHDSAGSHDIGTLPGDKNSYARAVNNSGQVVGCSSNGANRTCTAFLYDHGQMTSLGRLPGMSASDALAINAAGSVVGTTYSPTGAGFAFLWTRAGGMLDLNQSLPAGSGWVLRAATGINARGQIVGWGVIGGNLHAYLLNPAGA